MTKTSYLVAAVGKINGALVQAFANTPEEASNAVSALFLDYFGEECKAAVIDTEAIPGLFIEGGPAYIESVIKGKSYA